MGQRSGMSLDDSGRLTRVAQPIGQNGGRQVGLMPEAAFVVLPIFPTIGAPRAVGSHCYSRLLGPLVYVVMRPIVLGCGP
jgi:hypothetical protein